MSATPPRDGLTQALGVMEILDPREVKLVCSLTLRERIWASNVLIAQRWLSIVATSIWMLAGISLIVLYLYKGIPITPAVLLAALSGILFMPLLTVISAVSVHFNKVSREPFTYTFDSTGIHVSAVTYEYTHKWAAISHVKLLGGFLMFFFSPGRAHCMPLHAVNAAGVFRPLVNLAKEHGVSVVGI